MPFYKQTPFRTEIIEVTGDNINHVFAWVSVSPVVNAHSLTSESFVLQYLDNPPENVNIGSFVMRRTRDSFGVLPPRLMHERWQLLTDQEANSLPIINRQTKSLDEAWTRFSELVF